MIFKKAQNLASSPYWKYKHFNTRTSFYDFSFLNYGGYLNSDTETEKNENEFSSRTRDFSTQ